MNALAAASAPRIFSPAMLADVSTARTMSAFRLFCLQTSWIRRMAVAGGGRRNFLTVTDFGGLDVGIPQAMRRSIDFAANSRGTGAG